MAASRRPQQVDQDARGIVDPQVMARFVSLTRYPAGDRLDGLVAWFWAVRWSLPAGAVHEQQLLTHPAANLSVGHGEADDAGVPGPVAAELHGVCTRISSRRLGGTGWAVAALATPGGLGALVPGRAAAYTDRVVPLGPSLRRDGERLVAELLAVGGDDRTAEPARVDLLRVLLADVVADADPVRVAAARRVAEVARLAEADRTLERLEQLAAASGVSPRTLQRLFAEHAGVPVTWVLRRYRILEAAERARIGEARPWAELAADLGYSDQAHLVRDFRHHLGTTPAAYAARLSSGS